MREKDYASRPIDWLTKEQAAVTKTVVALMRTELEHGVPYAEIVEHALDQLRAHVRDTAHIADAAAYEAKAKAKAEAEEVA